jgi:WbqC-like protein family
MKRVAIVQSNYVPWKGYFDLIASVDEFMFLDDAQYTRRDWRNRNRIKTAAGVRWLTIPVKVRGRYHQRIDETEISDPGWARSHWEMLRQAYSEAPAFSSYAERLEVLYRDCRFERLSEINRRFTEEICAILRIRTSLTSSTDYGSDATRTERLVELCAKAGADEYLSGPAARAYLDETLFEREGIAVRWMDYAGYPEYPQLHPPFEHGVSVLDLILNTGSRARSYMLTSSDSEVVDVA